MDWATLMFGSPELRGRPEGPYFNPGHEQCLAERRAPPGRIPDRPAASGLRPGDARSGDHRRPPRLALLADAKARAGATRALLVVDYLQLLDVPEKLAEGGDELEAAKYRIRALQDVVRATRTDANPEGDAVLAISEARKPADAKTAWGNQLADLMGSSRVAYAADAVLLYRRMDAKDVGRYYGIVGEDQGDAARRRLEQLESDGVAPVVLTLAKARDGMTRGEFGLEFEFRMSTFRTIQPPDRRRRDSDRRGPTGARGGPGGRVKPGRMVDRRQGGYRDETERRGGGRGRDRCRSERPPFWGVVPDALMVDRERARSSPRSAGPGASSTGSPAGPT